MTSITEQAKQLSLDKINELHECGFLSNLEYLELINQFVKSEIK
jgi:hypothetical protein